MSAIMSTAYRFPTALPSSCFTRKLYQLVSTENPDILSFTPNGDAFEIKSPKRLEAEILPKYYRHCRFQSFVRQLCYYSFKKISKERNIWVYQNENFHRDHPELLENVKRKSSPPTPSTSRRPTTTIRQPPSTGPYSHSAILARRATQAAEQDFRMGTPNSSYPPLCIEIPPEAPVDEAGNFIPFWQSPASSAYGYSPYPPPPHHPAACRHPDLWPQSLSKQNSVRSEAGYASHTTSAASDRSSDIASDDGLWPSPSSTPSTLYCRPNPNGSTSPPLSTPYTVIPTPGGKRSRESPLSWSDSPAKRTHGYESVYPGRWLSPPSPTQAKEASNPSNLYVPVQASVEPCSTAPAPHTIEESANKPTGVQSASADNRTTALPVAAKADKGQEGGYRSNTDTAMSSISSGVGPGAQESWDSEDDGTEYTFRASKKNAAHDNTIQKKAVEVPTASVPSPSTVAAANLSAARERSTAVGQDGGCEQAALNMAKMKLSRNWEKDDVAAAADALHFLASSTTEVTCTPLPPKLSPAQ